MKRVLLTGPLESLAEYSAAARGAGWEPIEWPLLRIVQHRHDVSALLARRFDRVCVTSSNALVFLSDLCRATDSLRDAPCAVVGERSSARAREIGLRVDLTSSSASELASDLARVARAGERVLWPRGHLSDELARELRALGFIVVDPVVYASEPLEHGPSPPRTEAVLFASPSGVRAWHERERARAGAESTTRELPRAAIAVAIGGTTLDALMSETELSFFDTILLPEPTPEAFGLVLFHLDLGDVEPAP
jgi:uroporphyrinogen-III synthase